MSTFKEGDLVEVSETLQDILVLDNGGYTNWYPATRWTALNEVPKEKVLDIYGLLV